MSPTFSQQTGWGASSSMPSPTMLGMSPPAARTQATAEAVPFLGGFAAAIGCGTRLQRNQDLKAANNMLGFQSPDAPVMPSLLRDESSSFKKRESASTRRTRTRNNMIPRARGVARVAARARMGDTCCLQWRWSDIPWVAVLGHPALLIFTGGHSIPQERGISWRPPPLVYSKSLESLWLEITLRRWLLDSVIVGWWVEPSSVKKLKKIDLT